MGWQDDLRELDARLATGSVSADDYRRARDELLRKAQAGGGEQPAQQQQPPQPAPPPGQPFAPAPFRWEASSQPQPPVENTQIIQPVAGPPGDRTQVVSNPPDPTADRTQVVRGVGTPSESPWGVAPGPGHGGAPHTPPPWAAQQPQQRGGENSPPWAGQDFEPVVTPDMNWMRPGPESFDDRQTKGRGKVVGIAIAAVLVIGLAVAGFFFFTGKDDPSGPPSASTNQRPPAPTTKQLADPPAQKPEPTDNATALIDPPGTPRNGGGPFTPAVLQANGLLPKPVVTALTEAGLKQGLLKTTLNGTITIGMYALDVASEDEAQKVAKAYESAQREGGLLANLDMSLKGIPVYNTPTGTGDAVFRAVYVVYSRVVVVEAFGPERQVVQDAFKDLLTLQVEHAPPTKR